MFSLIITIISIALVAALAVATIYYGGSAFTQGTAKANASALVSAGQQVTGALTLYANDNGGDRGDTTTLVSGQYLSAVPQVKNYALSITANTVTATGVEDAVCDAVNTSAGVATQPATAAAGLATDGTGVTAPYFCAADGAFVFKG